MPPLSPGTVDYLCNAFTPDRAPSWARAAAGRGVPTEGHRDGDGLCEPDELVARLDELGIATVVVPVGEAPHHGAPYEHDDMVLRPDELDRLVTRHPGRFAGWWTIDPRLGWAGVTRARAAIDARPAVVGLWLPTHHHDRPFDAADLYPWYALAAEWGLAVAVQAGAGGGPGPSACGRPIGIDRPALYFPGVRFVLSHTGWPWVTEAVAMALKFPNVFLGTAAYPPRRWDPELVAFLRGPGRTKVLWGTDFPTVGHRHALAQLPELDLPPETRDLLLGGNVRRVLFRLQEVT